MTANSGIRAMNPKIPIPSTERNPGNAAAKKRTDSNNNKTSEP